MRLKKTIIRGKHIKALEQELDLPMLHIQCLLGLYAPTISKMFSEAMLEEPINRGYCGPIRFINHNWPKFFSGFPTLNLFNSTDLDDLLDVSEQSPLSIKGTTLDLCSIAHLGVVLFRGYGAARNTLNRESVIPLQLTQWINIVHYCLITGQNELIEAVIIEEAEAHKLDINKLLNSAWPAMKNE